MQNLICLHGQNRAGAFHSYAQSGESRDPGVACLFKAAIIFIVTSGVRANLKIRWAIQMLFLFNRLNSISVTALVMSVFAATGAIAQSNSDDAHLAIENPADLSKEEALRVYESLQRRMGRGYAAAQMDILLNYQNWPLFNDAPYISATHGQRFVNSYANRMAHNYGTLQPGEKLPMGSVLAKDSVTVTDEGNIHPGALFVMEKLADGANPDTADWRYIMVMPDGSLFGDTMGARARAVAYCHDCHGAVADRDYTFFVPEEYVVKN